MFEEELTLLVCQYINTHFRVKYKSNRDFSLACGIDEKTGRLIKQGSYNMSLKLLNQICFAHNVKMSEVLLAIGE